MIKTLTDDAMWHAFAARDRSYDGLFVVAVRTTGIFCRPTCPARRPHRRNVEFLSDPRAAVVAGYRPCRRCRPLEGDDAPAWLRTLVDRVERSPDRRLTDADLRAMSIDPARARRGFRRRYGMTFHAFQRARRLGAALTELRGGGDINAVGLRHGFSSASGFRAAFQRLFGMPPGRGRDAAAIVVRWMETPIGPFIGGASSDGVCLFEFADRRGLETQIASLRARFDGPAVPGTNEHLDRLAHEADEYFRGARTAFGVALDLRGTAFQTRVWARLREIPYGATISYSDLARAIGAPTACRAVARANGANRVAVVVPCHRVVREDGTLGGYGGGVERKAQLLALEGGTPFAGGRRPAAPARGG